MTLRLVLARGPLATTRHAPPEVAWPLPAGRAWDRTQPLKAGQGRVGWR